MRVEVGQDKTKTSICCEYERVEELPYGKQVQVDFGEYNMRNGLGERLHNKGKVEHVVKFTKQNFLYNRPFSDLL